MKNFDVEEEREEYLRTVVRDVIQAIDAAPQITARTEMGVDVLMGDELLPIIEGVEEMSKISAFIEWDAKTYRKSYEAGNPPALVLIGGNTTTSEMGWDCGACGFKTCGDFNKFSKENKSMGSMFTGPSCNWKVIDLAIASAWGCARAYKYKASARIQGSSGAAANLLGYLPDFDNVIGLPIFVGEEIWQGWFSRESMHGEFSHEDFMRTMHRTVTTIFGAFAGGGETVHKTSDRWWENPKWVDLTQKEGNIQHQNEVNSAFIEIVSKYGDQIRERYE